MPHGDGAPAMPLPPPPPLPLALLQFKHTPAPPCSMHQGTMTWGEQNTEEEAWQQLDYALAHNINFIDTGATDQLLLAVGG